MSEPEPEVEDEAAHLLIGEVHVSEYLAADTGERVYSVDYTDMPLSTLLGLLRLAEHWAISESRAADDEDEDDDDE